MIWSWGNATPSHSRSASMRPPVRRERTSRRTTRLALAALAAAPSGCFPEGPDFPPPEALRGVRVLAVTSNPASGTPGQPVELTLHAFDERRHPLLAQLRGEADAGAAPSSEALHVVWLGGCHNPPGDVQHGCYPGLAQLATQLPDPLPRSQQQLPPEAAGLLGVGPRFRVDIPEQALTGRQLESEAPPFGVSFAFFAVCRGTLRPDPDSRAVPLRCVDESGAPVDSNGFVRGFSTIYTYRDSVNQAPRIEALELDGVELSPRACQQDSDCDDYAAPSGDDDASDSTAANADAGDSAASIDDDTGFDSVCREVVPLLGEQSERRCVVALPACGGPQCPRYTLRARVPRSSVELDPQAAASAGVAPEELLWVKYYGILPPDPAEALINDRLTGFQPSYETEWRPLGRAVDTPLPVWAVVQDNRGGSSVARWDFVMREPPSP